MDQQKEIRFDNYVDTYKKEIQKSIDFIGQDVDFFVEIKAWMLLDLAEKYKGKLKTINALDVGSGVGLVDKYIVSHLGTLTGVDVEEGVVQKAKTNNPEVNYLVYDGHLPFEEKTFDLVFAFNVIHHVKPSDWQTFLNEMVRVLKSGGMAAVFEHNPANPLTRRAVKNCIFDRDAILLPHKKLKELFTDSGLNIVDDAYIIFFPFKGRIFRWMEKMLKRLFLGAQQYVIAIKS